MAGHADGVYIHRSLSIMTIKWN